MPMIAKSNDFEQMNYDFKTLKYLGNLSEFHLWHAYKDAFYFSGVMEPFTNFSLANKESFNKLKLKSIEERLDLLSQC